MRRGRKRVEVEHLEQCGVRVIHFGEDMESLVEEDLLVVVGVWGQW